MLKGVVASDEGYVAAIVSQRCVLFESLRPLAFERQLPSDANGSF